MKTPAQWEQPPCYQTARVFSPYLRWGVISSVAALSRLITSPVRRSPVGVTAQEEDPRVLLICLRHSLVPLDRRKVTTHNTQVLERVWCTVLEYLHYLRLYTLMPIYFSIKKSVYEKHIDTQQLVLTPPGAAATLKCFLLVISII